MFRLQSVVSSESDALPCYSIWCINSFSSVGLPQFSSLSFVIHVSLREFTNLQLVKKPYSFVLCWWGSVSSLRAWIRFVFFSCVISGTQHGAWYIVCVCVCVCMLSQFSHVWLYVTLWTGAHQAPLSMEFSRQECGVGWHALPQGIFPTQGLNLRFLGLQCWQVGSLLLVPPGKPSVYASVQFSSVQFSHSVVSDFLRPHESQHARPPCLSPTPGVHSDSRPSSQWCHPAIQLSWWIATEEDIGIASIGLRWRSKWFSCL